MSNFAPEIGVGFPGHTDEFLQSFRTSTRVRHVCLLSPVLLNYNFKIWNYSVTSNVCYRVFQGSLDKDVKEALINIIKLRGK